MDALLQQKEKILTKVASRIEKECNFKNGAFVTTLILLFIDPKTWTFDKSVLARMYQAIDIIEHNDELKQLFEEKEETK